MKKGKQLDLDGNPICEHTLYDWHLSGGAYCCLCRESIPTTGLLSIKKKKNIHQTGF